MTDLLVARRAAVIRGRNPRRISKGQIFRADDPIVKGREHLFRLLDVPDVEQATAAPGEKRTVTKPKRTKAADGGTD